MPPTKARLENLLKELSPKDRKLAGQFFEDRELVLTSGISYADTMVPFSRYTKKPLAKAAKEDIQGWLENERDRGISPGTIATHKRHLKAFYRWRAGGDKTPPSVKWIKGTSP